MLKQEKKKVISFELCFFSDSVLSDSLVRLNLLLSLFRHSSLGISFFFFLVRPELCCMLMLACELCVSSLTPVLQLELPENLSLDSEVSIMRSGLSPNGVQNEMGPSEGSSLRGSKFVCRNSSGGRYIYKKSHSELFKLRDWFTCHHWWHPRILLKTCV